MEKYIIIIKKESGYQLKYIYYGNIWNGMGISKKIGTRNKFYNYIENIFEILIGIILDNPKKKRRKIKRRTK